MIKRACETCKKVKNFRTYSRSNKGTKRTHTEEIKHEDNTVTIRQTTVMNYGLQRSLPYTCLPCRLKKNPLVRKMHPKRNKKKSVQPKQEKKNKKQNKEAKNGSN